MVGSKMAGEIRVMPDAGVVANKYQFVLMGNHQQAAIVTWSGALPKEGQQGEALYKAIPYKWEPDKWYHFKFSVKKTDSGADLKGKVWPKGDAEPKDWLLEFVDTQPNMEGSPGLFGESQVTPIKSEIYYDNIVVGPNQ